MVKETGKRNKKKQAKERDDRLKTQNSMADTRTNILAIIQWASNLSSKRQRLSELVNPSVCCSQNYLEIDKLDKKKKCFDKYQHQETDIAMSKS